MRRSLQLFFALSLFAFPSFAAITGVVMTSDGAPVAGAKVGVYAHETLEARRARLLSASAEVAPLASAQTDAKGTFSLESPKNAVVDLRISARGYLPSTRRVERDEEVGAITLTKAEPQNGTITANGKPLANALVSLWYDGGEVLVRTNEQGRYEAPNAKRLRWIAVVHPDYAIDEKLMVGSASASDLNRTLTAGTSLTGRVVAADGTTPVSGAAISLDGWPAGKSGEDGTFTIAHAPSRWSSITARKESLFALTTFNKQSPLSLRLGKASVISGRVLDSKSKLPIAGVVVRAGGRQPFGTHSGFSAETDAKGAYSMTVPIGSYTFFTSHPTYDAAPADAQVAPGQQVTKDFTLTQLGRVSGVVIDEAKRPVAAANVTADLAGDAMMRMRFMRSMNESVASGPDGRFSLRVTADEQIALTGTKRGLPQAKTEPMRVGSGERKSGVTLTIPNGLPVSGVVTDNNGKPLSGVVVTASESDTGRGGMFRMTFISGMNNDEDSVRTGSDGTFEMRVKEGTYDFSFRREGFAPKTVRAQNVTLSTSPKVEATLEPASEITGRVVRGGAGVEGVRVTAMVPTLDSSGVTGPDGTFTLSGLAAGNVRVMFRKEDDFIQEQRSITAPAREVLVELSSGGRVTGRVVDKDSGKPVATFQAGISASRGGGGMVMMAPPQLKDFNSSDGTFTLENVPAGSMVLLANAPGYAGARLNVTIEEGKTLSGVELQLESGVKLTGRVTGPNGAPVADASVRIMPSPTGSFSSRGMETNTTTNQNGEYSLEALPPGEETLSFSHPKYIDARKQVTLKGRETRLDVTLSSGQRVSGVVVTEAGAPVSDASVSASSGTGGHEVARTNANGAFEMESVAPGRYRFVASKAGLADGTLDDVDISSGGGIRITMRTGATIYGRVTGLSESEYANATVEVRGDRTRASSAVDPNGTYRVEGAPTGSVQVSASISGRFGGGLKLSSPKMVEVAPGGSQSVDIEFRSDVTVSGRVLRNGKALPNANVLFAPARGSRAQAVSSATTDQNGAYSVSGLDEGDYTVNVVDLQRFSPYNTTYQVRGSDRFDIEFRTGGIRGRVVDAATSEPVANVNVQLRAADPNTTIVMARGATTDVNGVFTIDAVPAAAYVISASREGFGSQNRDLQVGDQGIDDLELKLTRSDAATLKVVDFRNGLPLRARITVYNTQGQIVYQAGSFFDDAGDGELKLPLAAGQYSASVSAEGYAAQNVLLQSPSQPRVIGLTPGGTLVIRSKNAERRRVRLIDANGIPYQRFGPNLPSRELLPNPATTTLINIAPGTYTLQLLGPNEAPVESIQVTVQEGAVTQAEI
ncbi:MAG: carboxypeptidase regulatory-like domain-containing protein [Acidobacteriota bacterium]|nr:carboxypeptidase regulatory-like domain-containing protein [Acidobacteriota bacterium]